MSRMLGPVRGCVLISTLTPQSHRIPQKHRERLDENALCFCGRFVMLWCEQSD